MALGPIFKQIGSLTERIRDYDRKLEAISEERYPETELLGQVVGIGPLTALTFVLTVEDPYRFEKSRSVGAYLGQGYRIRMRFGSLAWGECAIANLVHPL